MRSVSTKRWEVCSLLLLLLSLSRGILYASLVPPWQAPDEPQHFEHIALLYEKRRFVREEDVSPALQDMIIQSMREYDFWRSGFSYVTEDKAASFTAIWRGMSTQLDRPPLYYLLCTPIYALVANWQIAAQLYVLRLVSVLLYTATVQTILRAARYLFPGDLLLAVSAAAFALLVPMHSFIAGSVNSDNLANLLASVTIYVLLIGVRSRFSWRQLLVLAGLLSAGLFTKRTTAFLLPLTVVVVLVFRRQLFGKREKWIAARIAILMGVVALGSTAFLVWYSAALRAQFVWMLDNYLADSSFVGYLETLAGRSYVSSEFGHLLVVWLTQAFVGFWGDFGWAAVKLEMAWYIALASATLVALLGLILFVIRVSRIGEAGRWPLHGILVLCLAVACALGMVLAKQAASAWDTLAQGRYLFPAILPISILYVIGWRESFPHRVRDHGLFLLVVGLVILDGAALWLRVLPFFYG